MITLRRSPRSATDAALYAGLTLLALMLLAPSGRIGYLVYPVSLLVWAYALADGTRARLDGESPEALASRLSVTRRLVRPPGLEPGTN